MQCYYKLTKHFRRTESKLNKREIVDILLLEANVRKHFSSLNLRMNDVLEIMVNTASSTIRQNGDPSVKSALAYSVSGDYVGHCLWGSVSGIEIQEDS
jgi:hypothetical protein